MDDAGYHRMKLFKGNKYTLNEDNTVLKIFDSLQNMGKTQKDFLNDSEQFS